MVVKVLAVNPIHHRIVLAAMSFPDEPLVEVPKPPVEVPETAEMPGE